MSKNTDNPKQVPKNDKVGSIILTILLPDDNQTTLSRTLLDDDYGPLNAVEASIKLKPRPSKN